MSSQKIKLSPGLEYTLKSMTRGKDYQPITNRCLIPNYTITIDSESNCFLCGCNGWLPVPVGKVTDFNSISEVLSSPTALMIRKDVADKKYTWCAVEQCGIINRNIDNNNVKVYNLNIGIDNSCNLACPSCRRESMMISSGPIYEQKLQDTQHIMKWLENFNETIFINFGGSGDPLASSILRPLILSYIPKHNQHFVIGTNGLLVKKLMPKSKIAKSVSNYKISVDAGSAEVYEQVRRPGQWNDLLDNLQWLKDNRIPNQSIELSFLVQRTNYQDIPRFVDLCEQFGFVGTLDSLVDWGTWNPTPVETPDAYTLANGTFLDHDVANPNHPKHKEFVNEIKNFLLLKQNCVTMKPYFNKFLN